MSKSVYHIHLAGIDGDTHDVLTDKETFDWVTDPDFHGRGKKGTPEYTCWLDDKTPKRVADRLAEDDDAVMITSGSYQNDRALFLGEEQTFFGVDGLKEVDAYVKKHHLTIVDVYEGLIY